MRHLTEHQAAAALRRGAAIEQMLTSMLATGTVEWLTAAATGSGATLRRHEVVHDGSDAFLDVYEFRPVDEDDYLGEGTLVAEFPDARWLLEGAMASGARLDRWVHQGVIQDEYADLRSHS